MHSTSISHACRTGRLAIAFERSKARWLRMAHLFGFLLYRGRSQPVDDSFEISICRQPPAPDASVCAWIGLWAANYRRWWISMVTIRLCVVITCTSVTTWLGVRHWSYDQGRFFFVKFASYMFGSSVGSHRSYAPSVSAHCKVRLRPRLHSCCRGISIGHE